MKKEVRSALTSIVFLFCIYLLSFLGSNVVSTIQSINSFTFLLFLSVIIQVIFFIPSFILKTEKLYDLIGSTTYVIVALIAYLSVDNKTSTDTILFLLLLYGERGLVRIFLKEYREIAKMFDLKKQKETFFGFFSTGWDKPYGFQ